MTADCVVTLHHLSIYLPKVRTDGICCTACRTPHAARRKNVECRIGNSDGDIRDASACGILFKVLRALFHRHAWSFPSFLPYYDGIPIETLEMQKPDLMRLDRVVGHGLYTSHHLLLGDQVVDSLQQAQKALHAPAPLVEDFVRVAGLGKRDDARGPVDFGVDRLGRHELADVAFRLFFVQIEQLGEPVHLDAGVVLRYDAHVVFDDPLAEILPARVSFRVFLVGGCGCSGEDVGGAEVGAEALGDDGPTHELGDREGFEQLLLIGDEGVAGVGVYAMEEVGLLVVVGSEEDVVDDSLEDLEVVSCRKGKERARGWFTACNCSGFSSTDSVSRTCR